MRRLAILLLIAVPAMAVITASPAPGCDLLKHLLHRCKSCYHCGGHKCHYAKCHRPKCHCSAAPYHSHGYHAHGSAHYGYYGSKYHRHQRYYGGPSYGGPSYVEPAAPVYEEIVPQAPGRDF